MDAAVRPRYQRRRSDAIIRRCLIDHSFSTSACASTCAFATARSNSRSNKISPDGCVVEHAITWKKLPIYRARDRLPKEELNTKALFTLALDHGCDAIAFTRDRDRHDDREAAVNRGLAWLRSAAEARNIAVVGGVAVECLEAWLLALGGTHRTEKMSVQKACDQWTEGGAHDTSAIAAHVERADLAKMPEDAASLLEWLAQARSALAP